MNNYQIIEAFKAAMREYGIESVDPILADGVIHRFKIAGQKPGSLNGAYKLHLDGAKPAGYFEDFKNGIKATWKADGPIKTLTQAERQQIEDARNEREQLRLQRYEQAANAAQRILNTANPIIG